VKQITIAGNIGRDAESRTTQGGDSVTGFTVAVEDRAAREKSTIWFDVSIWGNRGEKLAQYIKKGGKIAVTGDLGRREHEGKTYLSIRADNVTLLGSRGGDNSTGSPSGETQHQETGRGYPDDEIPF
jgi:single-strand DNA-binding protein